LRVALWHCLRPRLVRLGGRQRGRRRLSAACPRKSPPCAAAPGFIHLLLLPPCRLCDRGGLPPLPSVYAQVQQPGAVCRRVPAAKADSCWFACQELTPSTPQRFTEEASCACHAQGAVAPRGPAGKLCKMGGPAVRCPPCFCLLPHVPGGKAGLAVGAPPAEAASTSHAAHHSSRTCCRRRRVSSLPLASDGLSGNRGHAVYPPHSIPPAA